jgi:hypothetical protein
MLFRPLQEKRIFGIRLPFTPGIIPRQRGKLATNVGRMVSEKLFTVETIRGHLNRPEIQQGLALNLAVSLTELTEKPLSEVFPFLFENEGREIQAMLTGSEFQKSFQGFLEPVADFLWKHSWEDLFPEDSQGKPQEKALFSEKNLAKFQKDWENWLDDLEEKNLPLGGVIGTQAWQALEEAFRGLYYPLAHALLGWLRKPKVKSVLESKGRVFLRQVIEKLNGLQRFLVSTVQYDKTLDEEMPKLVIDLIQNLDDFLQNDKTREELMETFFGGVRAWLSTPWNDIPQERREVFKTRIRGLISSGFRSLSSFSGSNNPFRHFLDSLRTRPLGLILEEYFHWEKGEFPHRAWEIWQGGLGGDFFQSERYRGWGEKRLADLFPLQEENIQGISQGLIDTGLQNIDPVLEKAIAGLDVQGMVESKINQLELEQVEQLLLMVIKNHLGYINIFGGVLGGIIGGVQSLMMYLTGGL